MGVGAGVSGVGGVVGGWGWGTGKGLWGVPRSLSGSFGDLLRGKAEAWAEVRVALQGSKGLDLSSMSCPSITLKVRQKETKSVSSQPTSASIW